MLRGKLSPMDTLWRLACVVGWIGWVVGAWSWAEAWRARRERQVLRACTVEMLSRLRTMRPGPQTETKQERIARQRAEYAVAKAADPTITEGAFASIFGAQERSKAEAAKAAAPVAAPRPAPPSTLPASVASRRHARLRAEYEHEEGGD